MAEARSSTDLRAIGLPLTLVLAAAIGPGVAMKLCGGMSGPVAALVDLFMFTPAPAPAATPFLDSIP